MATRKFKIATVGKTLQWQWADTGKVAFQADASKVHENLLEGVFMYGFKQIIADGGALEKGASSGEIIAMMEKRYNSLVQGTWGTRVAPTITDEKAMEVLAKSMGKTVDEIRAMLNPTE